jgi:hypothetical protein
MLVLLYALTHDNENLILQIPTGQGKSLISLSWDIYLALKGITLDNLSSKSALSERDHKEAEAAYRRALLDSSYINSSSSANAYKQINKKERGGLNYSTLGNLTVNRQRWLVNDSIIHDKKNCYGVLDEADYHFFDENTIFRYADAGKGRFNYDVWVYEVVARYYLEKIAPLKLDKIDTKDHLDPLLQAILAERYKAPKASNFISANKLEQPNDQTVDKLAELLLDMHAAASLKKGIHYAIKSIDIEINEQIYRKQFAMVIDKNQLQPGSTYDVQYALHTLLNEESKKRGEAPEFFVEPIAPLVLSENLC